MILKKKLEPRGRSDPTLGQYTCTLGRMKVDINDQGHMTKMATMAINSKNV